MGINLVGVRVDNDGLVPEHLLEILDNWTGRSMGTRCMWPTLTGPTPKPRVLYMIPNGANPTGTSQPLERRRTIYRIAQQHQLLIIEDDPYYYLQVARPACRVLRHRCAVRRHPDPQLSQH